MPIKTLDRAPVTETSLRRDLAALGVEPGPPLIVHSSLSAIGWVVGGAPTVVRALLAAVGDEGTLAMPAATPQCADPATWSEPRIPDRWLEQVRDNLPVFDPRTTPTGLGVIPETFRNWPGVLRSDHPVESVCARGPLADEITREHPLEFSEGPGAPFGKLLDLDSRILLLGVGFNRCTALHTAETLVDKRRTMTETFPIWDGDQRVWVTVQNVANDRNRLFPLIGERYLTAYTSERSRAEQGPVGNAQSILFPMRNLVSFAQEQFEALL